MYQIIHENKIAAGQDRTMSQHSNETGELLYSESRNVMHEQVNYVLRGVGILLFVFLLIYAGSRESIFLALMATLLFGALIYPAVLSLLVGFTGIHELKVYEHGFVPPFCTDIKVNVRYDSFISWGEMEHIYLNKNLRISKIFPYVLIKLRSSYIAIPEGKIIDLSLFLKAIDPFTTVITTKEYRHGIHPVEYHPPSLEARLEDEAIILHYGDEVRSIHYRDIKKIKLNMIYQVVLMNGKRIGLLGMSREDVERIRISHGNYTKGRSSEEAGVPSGGVLQSETDMDEMTEE